MQRTLPIAEFLWKLLQHVLPPGFHRVREYGFVHANAKAALRRVQWVLKVLVESRKTPRPASLCRCCQTPMTVT